MSFSCYLIFLYDLSVIYLSFTVHTCPCFIWMSWYCQNVRWDLFIITSLEADPWRVTSETTFFVCFCNVVHFSPNRFVFLKFYEVSYLGPPVEYVCVFGVGMYNFLPKFFCVTNVCYDPSSHFFNYIRYVSPPHFDINVVIFRGAVNAYIVKSFN